MSGHGIPRSFRHMDGFGVHTFRFVDDDGKSKLIKYHFKTQQGLASLVWPEAQVLNGKNSDFHRQDLWDAIESKNFPEWEIGVQIIDEEDVLKFGFDLLDPTKILPIEHVPITPIGKLVLNRNVRNYFAETEQSMVSSLSLFTSDHGSLKLCAVLPWPCCPRYRLLQRSSPPGPSILVHRHSAQPQHGLPQL